MPNPLGRGATRNLTRIGLVLSHRRASAEWLRRAALLVGGLALGALAGYQYADQQPGRLEQQAATALEQQQLQQRLEQGQLTLRVSESRGQELERQIAALVQQLRECREELSFFRKARDGKH